MPPKHRPLNRSCRHRRDRGAHPIDFAERSPAHDPNRKDAKKPLDGEAVFGSLVRAGGCHQCVLNGSLGLQKREKVLVELGNGL